MFQRRPLAFLIVALFLSLSIYVFLLTILFSGREVGALRRSWSAHYALLFEDEGLAASGEVALREAGYSVVSRRTATVRFATFAGLTGQAEVSLAELSRRLDPEDPRLDPYLRSLGSYFDSDGKEILYVASEAGPLGAFRSFREVLGPPELGWSMPDWVGVELLLTIFGVVAVVVGTCIWSGRKALLVAASGLGWIGFALQAGPAAVAAAGPALLGWAFFLDGGLPWIRDRIAYGFSGVFGFGLGSGLRSLALPTGGGLMGLGASVAIAVGTGLDGGGYLGAVFAGLVGSVCLMMLEPLRGVFREHRVFVPLRLAGDRPWSVLRAVAVLAVGSVCVLVPMLANHAGAPELVLVPTPIRPAEEEPGFSFAAFQDLADARPSLGWVSDAAAPPRLPDLADYLSHRAYQEGLVYGREYGFPESGEEVRLSRFSFDRNQVSRRDEVVATFDDTWLASGLAPLRHESGYRGVEALLMSEATPVRVVSTPIVGIYFPQDLLLRQTMILLFGFLPFLTHAVSPALLVRNGLVGVTPRRKRQEA